MSDLEIKEVCSGTTQLDISYETFCEEHPPRYGRYDIWKFCLFVLALRFVFYKTILRMLDDLNNVNVLCLSVFQITYRIHQLR